MGVAFIRGNIAAPSYLLSTAGKWEDRVADTVIKTLKKNMKVHQRDFDKSMREHKRRLDEMSSQLEKLSKMLPKGKKAKRKST